MSPQLSPTLASLSSSPSSLTTRIQFLHNFHSRSSASAQGCVSGNRSCDCSRKRPRDFSCGEPWVSRAKFGGSMVYIGVTARTMMRLFDNKRAKKFRIRFAWPVHSKPVLEGNRHERTDERAKRKKKKGSFNKIEWLQTTGWKGKRARKKW